MSQNKNELNVVDSEESCFTYTPDLAMASKKLIFSKKISGIYHVVNEGKCTWFEAIRELFKIKNIETKINPVSSDRFPRPAKRPEYSVLKNTKLPKLRNYKEALKEYLNI
jgi:dTDP-4-dehydrorhamnose reductase